MEQENFQFHYLKNMKKGDYVILAFTAENILQQIMLIWKEDDVYANEIMERVVNSVELKKAE